MRQRLLAIAMVIGLAACGSNRTDPKATSDDRLLLLVWNYPDTGVTRLLVQLHDDDPEAGSGMLAPESDEVEASATLKSPAHTLSLDGSYDHDGDYFSLTRRNGADSLIMFGVYRPTQPLSPVIIDMTFSGPPAGNGSAYGVRDTVGTASFFCASYILADTTATRSFGLIVTDSLIIGLGGALPVPFSGVARGDSLIMADGSLLGTRSADRSTVAGTLTVLGQEGQWSGRRCEVTSS